MTTLAGVPYVHLAFDQRGDHAAFGPLCPPDTTDLVVLSHGWKNDRDDARHLYEQIVGHMLAAGGATSGRRFAAAGVQWPAFKYEEDLSLLPDTLDPRQVDRPGVALRANDVAIDALRNRALTLARELGVDDAEAFADAAVDARGGGGAADDFVEQLRAAVLTPDLGAAGARDEHKTLFKGSGANLLQSFANPPGIPIEAATDEGRPTAFKLDIAKTIYRFRSGASATVSRVLNQFTYFEMKARAGVVGHALGRYLDTIELGDVRVHLVGHSFGGRLVAAAANAMNVLRPASMVLLQAAFSHNGFGQGVGKDAVDGVFRRVVIGKRVTGPIAATHTHNDSAVGFFYPLASWKNNDIAQAFGVSALIGGPEDLHGGMGANGTQGMLDDEAVSTIAVPGTPLNLTPGKINNVLADAIITNHNDVKNADAGRIVWASIKGI